jgi:hypothetical protein
VIGWSSDGHLYVEAAAHETRMALHVEKLNPHTGVRTAWRELGKPTIAGVSPDRPIISPDGASYLYNYRLSLHDLYTVNGVR